MTRGPVTVFGAGGHAKVAVDVLRAAGEAVDMCLAPESTPPVAGVPVVAEREGVELLAQRDAPRVFVAIGDNTVRSRVADDARRRGWQVVTAISPHAYVADDVVVGSGTLIVHGAIVNAATVIGDDVIVNTGATIDHDNRIGSGAHVAPGCHLAGTVHVGDRAFVGIGTAVIPGVTIGAEAIVGAGSVVIRDLPARTRSWGNPALLEGKTAP